jgi:integrase
MSTAVSRAPKRVSSRALQRIKALRQAIPPVYQAASETTPEAAEVSPEAQYELALFATDITETLSETQRRPGTPWNRGRMVGAKLPLKPKHVWSLRFHLHRENRVRDLALFDLVIDSKLRGCDLIKLRTGDLILDGQPKLRATVIQQKTGKPVTFELTEQTRESLLAWLKLRGGNLEDFVFPSRTNPAAHISTRQYARLVDEWMVAIDLNPAFYGTHSMRRTKVALIYKKTGNLRAVQILLGHTKLESTVRYLGVDIDDALSLSEAADL